jgi:hypothetical protein
MLEVRAMHPSADLRNVAIVGHAASGQTILSEAMLACSGAIGRMGRIADGSTVCDETRKNRRLKESVGTFGLIARFPTELGQLKGESRSISAADRLSEHGSPSLLPPVFSGLGDQEKSRATIELQMTTACTFRARP